MVRPPAGAVRQLLSTYQSVRSPRWPPSWRNGSDRRADSPFRVKTRRLRTAPVTSGPEFISEGRRKSRTRPPTLGAVRTSIRVIVDRLRSVTPCNASTLIEDLEWISLVVIRRAVSRTMICHFALPRPQRKGHGLLSPPSWRRRHRRACGPFDLRCAL